MVTRKTIPRIHTVMHYLDGQVIQGMVTFLAVMKRTNNYFIKTDGETESSTENMLFTNAYTIRTKMKKRRR
jgi:hypothetical protein